MEENFSNKMAAAKTREEREALLDQSPVIQGKIDRIKQCTRMLIHHKDYVKGETWNKRFDMPMALYLEQVADTNMRLFLGMATEDDK